MVSKSKKAKAPNTDAYAALSDENSRRAYDLSAKMFEWAKATWAADKDVQDRVMGKLSPLLDSEARAMTADRKRYDTVFKPMEDQMIATAKNYVTPERIQEEQGAAIADVRQNFAQERKNAEDQLMGYGIDPGQVKMAALDRDARVAEAAASAGAGTMAKRNVEEVGRGLVKDVVGLGRSYQGQIAQEGQNAATMGAGISGVSSGVGASGANLMGNPMDWSNSGAAQGRDYQSILSSNYGTATQGAANSGSGFGKFLGTAAGMAIGAYAGGGWAGAVDGGKLANGAGQ